MSGFFAFLGVESDVLARRIRLFALGALIGAALIMLAAGFLAFAAYLALADVMKPWQAALTTGALSLVLGAIIVVGALEALRRAGDQVGGAVRANALSRAAPLAAHFAVRSPKVVAGAAAAIAAIAALLRVLSAKSKPDG